MEKIGGILRFFILTAVLFLTASLFSQEKELTGFLKDMDAVLYWNPVTESGIIKKGNCIVSFKISSPLILFDYTLLKRTGDWKRDKNGAIWMPETAVTSIKEYFRQNVEELFVPKVACILIDPGHGGKDPGAIGDHKSKDGSFKVYEKDIVLAVGKELFAMLKERYQDKKIIMTRSDDTFLKLEQRTNMANGVSLNANEAIIFISIHANASFNKQADGYEVWYLPIDYRRNLIDEKQLEGDDKNVLPILNTMLEEEFSIESITLARSIIEQLGNDLAGFSVSRGTKAESWFVVRNARMPSVLIETGFVTNYKEAKLLNDAAYLHKLSVSLYNGVCNFVSKFERSKGFTE